MIFSTLTKKLNIRSSTVVNSQHLFRLSSVITMTNPVEDIEELHREAMRHGSSTYIDPETGFQVFTELTHLKRGFCCGNECRHCPYGFENVRNGVRRPAKLKSGDKAAAQRMAKAILQPAQHQRQQRSLSSTSKSQSTKNVPYTKKGDSGTSQLGTGERRSKTDDAFEAMGSVDELCAFVGVVHSHLNADEDYGKLDSQLLDIMSRLFDVGSHIAKPRSEGNFQADGIGGGFEPNHIEDLEAWIDEMSEELPELTNFILPTGAKAASHLHVARTVCRRAERRLVPLATQAQTCDPNALKYLNRLSDYFFVAARWVNFVEGYDEIQYQRKSSKTQRQRVPRSLQGN